MEIRELQLLPDDKLAALAQSGNLDAEEALLKKYKDAVRIKANMYYMAGADEDDVMQEGMIGLMKAIRQYSPEREASFGTFAGICITRQIISAIRSADRDKHKALNTSVSLSRPLETGNEEVTLADTLSSGTGESPEEILIYKDILYYILHNGDNIFSEFEMNVLSEFIKGNDYEKIADKLGKNVKSVDNAMQRTRKKILGYLFK